MKTKRSSLALLKKEFEEQSKVPNRSSRRQKKTFGKKKKKPSATTAAAAATTSEQPPPPAAAQAEAEAEAPAAPKKGMFEGVKETLDAVNKQSYYQALALNKELEDKGVLPPLERKPKPSPPGGDKEGGVVAEDSPDLATAAASTEGVANEGQDVVASRGGGGKRRKKGGKAKKSKRK